MPKNFSFLTRCVLIVLFFSGATTACQVKPTQNPPTSTPTKTPYPTNTPTPEPTSTDVADPPTIPTELDGLVITPTLEIGEGLLFGFTYQNSNGNRYVLGTGNVPGKNPLTTSLMEKPKWVVGAPTNFGEVWAVVLESGAVQAFLLSEEKFVPVEMTPAQLSPGMPPLLMVHQGVPSLVTPPSDEASLTTHPIVLGKSNRMVYVNIYGDLILWEGQEIGRLEIEAIPDARILYDEDDRLLLLSGATREYRHGVLGDDIEASSISLIETFPDFKIQQQIFLPEGTVIEGIAPIWEDMNNDGSREIIVTRSSEKDGAQILIYDETGQIVGVGPPIGRGYRWRHQLLVAPLGSPETWSLVDDLTPHIGGVIELYDWTGNNLGVVSQIAGLSTHQIGTRNLDMVIAGDFDSNGIVELLVPNQAMNQIIGIRQSGGSLVKTWTINLPAKISTNFGTIEIPDGNLSLGVGLENGSLYVWKP